jgi:hypothetical protein
MATKTKRKLSPKQIKYFGSPQQKAALKRKRSLAAKKSPVRKSSAKKSVKKKTTTKTKVVSQTNWLATIAAGLGGLGVGAAGGALLSDQVNNLLSNVPVIGGYFKKNTQTPQVPTDPVEAALTAQPTWYTQEQINSANSAGESAQDMYGTYAPGTQQATDLAQSIADLSNGLWNTAKPLDFGSGAFGVPSEW